MEIRPVKVTPELAKEWLAQNIDNNRKIRDSRVIGYVEDMLNERWVESSGDTIKFDVNNRLIDGQHRLEAVIKAGKTITFHVAFGVPITATTVIDTGASRTFGDTMRFQGATHSSGSGAIVRWVILYERGMYTGKNGRYAPTAAELVERYWTEHELFDEAARRGRDTRRYVGGSSAASGTAYYLFAKQSEKAAKAIFDSLVGGANIPEKSPILAMIRRLRRVREDRVSPPETLAMFIRMWNSYVTDEPVSVLLNMGTDKKRIQNENFPRMVKLKKGD